MSFRKRNVGVTGSSRPKESATEEYDPRISPKGSAEKFPPLGVRPSPVDGSPIISTGTPSLDNLLAGHAGLVLGNVLLIEESGATDYAATLLRYYAAEGVLQGHHVHVVGVGEQWGRELPGLARGSKGQAEKEERSSIGDTERMRIAWRYERFGESSTNSRGGHSPQPLARDLLNKAMRFYCSKVASSTDN
jgi:elongator complex protein 4